jgi:MOSC domain-containing protein YiiM
MTVLQSGLVTALYAGTIAPLGQKAAPSAIRKAPAPAPWRIEINGLVGDSHGDQSVHGGPEKALHHYPAEHYAAWSTDDPTLAGPLGHKPAFGENLSPTGLTENNVCLGDVFRLGPVKLQVSQGRQPCWKLNALFARDDLAQRVQKTGRTGWYYRVLETGDIRPGEVLQLVERPQPDWPLSRAIRLLFRRTLDRSELEGLASIPEVADGWRRLALRRLQTGAVEDWSARLGKA